MNRGCRLVLSVLENSDRIVTAQEIYDLLRKNEVRAPGLTTVYRALDSLCAMDRISVFNTGDGERRYSVANKSEHLHHIICNSCYLAIPIAHCSLVENAENTASNNGFEIESHVAEFYGKCSDCKELSDKDNSEGKAREHISSPVLAGSSTR